MLKAAGLSYRWIHATRHAFTNRMIISGGNIVYVQKRLEHSNIQLPVGTYTEMERIMDVEVDRLNIHFSGEVGTEIGIHEGIKTG